MSKNTNTNKETIIYQAPNGAIELRKDTHEETLWGNLNQIAEVFGRDKSVISRHIKNIFNAGELLPESTIAKIATVQREGNRKVLREMEYYNLDVIISVGYRVDSIQATKFRQWATQTLRQHITEGYTINSNRIQHNYNRFLQAVEDVKKLSNNSNIPTNPEENNSPPEEGWQAKPDGVVLSRASQNYFSLPYNPKLKERARELRKSGNLSEVLFWQQVKKKQFKGLDFDRQKIVGNYIVDFYCSNLSLVVEIDGSSHDDKLEYDLERDAFLEGLGLKVIHISDSDIKKDLEGVMAWLGDHPAFESNSRRPPRPTGTPPREGNDDPALRAPLQGRGMPPRPAGTSPGEGNATRERRGR